MFLALTCLICANPFALCGFARAEGSSEQWPAGSSIAREALELGVDACLLGVWAGWLKDASVWPDSPRFDTTMTSELPEENIEARDLVLGAGLLGAGIGLLPNDAGRFNHITYRHAKGFIETTVIITPLLTEIAKLTAGKKRPIHDAALLANPEMGESARIDLYKSFWSGHSAAAYGSVTYFNLFLIGHVQPDSRRSLVWKAPLAVGLFGLAGHVAQSRIDDNRHEGIDVTVGALVGTLTAVFVYAVHDNRLWGIYGDGDGASADHDHASAFNLRITAGGIGIYRSF